MSPPSTTAGFPNGQALEPILTEAEVAGALRVTDRTVRRWDAEGILQAIRIGGVKRYRASDIAALIDPSNDDAPGRRTQGIGKASDDGARPTA